MIIYVHTHQENEEDEENVGQKESRSQGSVCAVQIVKVEIAQNQSQQREDGVAEVAVVRNLRIIFWKSILYLEKQNNSNQKNIWNGFCSN